MKIRRGSGEENAKKTTTKKAKGKRGAETETDAIAGEESSESEGTE